MKANIEDFISFSAEILVSAVHSGEGRSGKTFSLTLVLPPLVDEGALATRTLTQAETFFTPLSDYSIYVLQETFIILLICMRNYVCVSRNSRAAQQEQQERSIMRYLRNLTSYMRILLHGILSSFREIVFVR
jgi:hypothetical protein